MADLTRKVLRVFLFAWMPVTLVLLWWFAAPRQSIYFPALWVILDNIRDKWLFGLARTDLVPSLEHLAIGYGIAVGGGIVLGTILYAVKPLYKLSYPFISFLRGLPSIALIPPLLIILGLGGTFKVGIIALGAVQPVLLNTINGLESVDEVQVDTASSFRLSAWRRMTKVMLPAASPQIVAGCRSALQAALILMVASEIIASTQGIGFQIVNAEQDFDGPGMWAGMVILGFLGILLNTLFILLERGVLRWYFGMRAMEKSSS